MSYKTSMRVFAVSCLLASSVGLNLHQSIQSYLESRPEKYPNDENYQRITEKFHRMFYYDSNTWLKNRWLGIPTEQNPNDIWIIQEIICDVKPDLIIETGTLRGGSAVLWAVLLEQVNPGSTVLTIDIENNATDARELAISKRLVGFLLGSSTDPAIVAEVTARAAGKTVMVILDSDHSKDHVLQEMTLYSPLVSLGSYLIVQDTNINGHPVLEDFGPGPMEALTEFLNANHRFVVDRSRERLHFTMHPSGYLKRVR